MDYDTDGAAVDKIADLAKNAHGFTLHKIVIENGDEIGLPLSIGVGFDHRENGRGLTSLKEEIEKYRLHPERRTGVATVHTLTSFIDLVNRHKTAHSVIFAATSWPNPSLTAVIDYHEKENGKPAFGEHRLSYPFPVSDEFKAWADQNGKSMDQGTFAAFVEERVAELAEASKDEKQRFETLFGSKMASPAEMLSLSRGLEIHVAGQVKNTCRLQSGESEIVFTEEHLDASGAKITVPGLFMVCVPAFLDGEAVRLPGRLRYRKNGSSIVWWYQLYRWKELLRERVVADLYTATAETDLPAYEGTPERPRG